jgi:hypothetical protein
MCGKTTMSRRGKTGIGIGPPGAKDVGFVGAFFQSYLVAGIRQTCFPGRPLEPKVQSSETVDFKRRDHSHRLPPAWQAHLDNGTRVYAGTRDNAWMLFAHVQADASRRFLNLSFIATKRIQRRHVMAQ